MRKWEEAATSISETQRWLGRALRQELRSEIIGYRLLEEEADLLVLDALGVTGAWSPLVVGTIGWRVEGAVFAFAVAWATVLALDVGAAVRGGLRGADGTLGCALPLVVRVTFGDAVLTTVIAAFPPLAVFVLTTLGLTDIFLRTELERR